MDNKDYGLNINNDYIKLFQKNLGFGNPLTAKYWFIGNEEDFDSYEDFKQQKYIYETPENKVNNNKLLHEESDLFRRSEHKGFFTKTFSTLYGDGSYWDGYSLMEKYSGEILDKIFISEIYFLPASQGKVYKQYGGVELEEQIDENGEVYFLRKHFYQKNNLEPLLKERLQFIKSILLENNITDITIIIYSQNQYTKELTEEIFDGYTANKIIYTPFITSNAFNKQFLKND